MNRQQRRSAAKRVSTISSQYGETLEEVQIEDARLAMMPKGLLRVLRSRRLIVMEFAPRGHAAPHRLLNVAMADSAHANRITWADLMAVKAQCGYPDLDALEVLPREVDRAKQAADSGSAREIWVLQGAIPFVERA